MSPTTPPEDHEHGEDREKQRFVPIQPPPEIPAPPAAHTYEVPPDEIDGLPDPAVEPGATVLHPFADETIVAPLPPVAEADGGLIADLLGEPEAESLPQDPPSSSAWTGPAATRPSTGQSVPDDAAGATAHDGGFDQGRVEQGRLDQGRVEQDEDREQEQDREQTGQERLGRDRMDGTPVATPAMEEARAESPSTSSRHGRRAAAEGGAERTPREHSADHGPAVGFLQREVSVGPVRLRGSWWALAAAALVLVVVLVIVLAVVTSVRQEATSSDPAPAGSAAASSAPASDAASPSRLPTAVRQAIADGAYVGAGGPAPAEVTEASAVLDGDVAVIVTPSGNIGCDLAAEDAGCGVKSYRDDDKAWWAALRGDGAPALSSRSQEPAWMKAGHRAQVVEYGQVVEHGSLVCASERTGLTCWDVRTGHGVYLHRNGNAAF